MTLLAPHWLWLLLAIPLVWFVPSRLTDVRHGVLRSLVFLFLILGMAQPVAVGDNATPHVVFIATDANRIEIARGLAANRPDAHTVLVTPEAVAGFDEVVELDDAGSTALIDRALDAAARSIPEGAPGAVVLCTPGQSQTETYGPALQSLTSRGIPVHRTPVGYWPTAVCMGVDVLEPLRVGRTARLRVRLREFDGFDGGVLNGPPPSLEAWSGRLIATVNVSMSDPSALLTFEPEKAGFLPVQLVRGPTADGTDPLGGDYADLVLPVQAPVRALYLGERMVEGGNRLSALVGQGVSLETRALDGGNPKDVLDGFDLVVLDDRPADTIPEAFQKELVSAVRDRGMGLVAAGGRAAFGAGGWHKSPLASLLPVEFLHREEKRDPSTTLVVIIDTSGSMGGGRVQLAKEVARLAIRRLLPHDKVGIVEFYGAKRWAAPIQPASNSIEIERALNRLNAGGGTVILPAIEEAFYGLQNVQTRYKHVLVLTDGGVERGAFEPLLRKMADKGMNVSTVLIGRQAHSEFLV
ncbi:MAG: VWA domain-containing protein, partial [Planctomycetota bacterium]|nr:VWA domain-containing protein [Planctomycetota bacterium]